MAFASLWLTRQARAPLANRGTSRPVCPLDGTAIIAIELTAWARKKREVPVLKGYMDLIVHSGNRPLVEALETSIVSLLAGRPLHVHVEGLRGTGKTTIIRAMRDVLPVIERIRGCPYNCDLLRPHCPLHRDLSPEAISSLGKETIPVPFLEISHAAKMGTVVGSIDLARIADPAKPEAALLPGILPRASRGIVFVDEINRLADTSPELTDVLLDVMGTKPGRLQIEETGLPTFEIPITCSVWAASNPDEEPGALEDIRRQLSDRFDFTVNMGRPQDHSTVKRILIEEDRGPSGTNPQAAKPNLQDLDALRKAVSRGSSSLPGVTLPDDLASVLAEMYVDFGMESLRAVEAIALGARARAALESRDRASLDDIRTVLPFALRHRVDASTLINIGKFLDEYELRCGRRREPDPPKDETPESAAGRAEEIRHKEFGTTGDLVLRPDSLWERLMRGIGLAKPETGTPATGQAHRASSSGSPAGSPGEASPGYGAGGSGISDPTDVPLSAPPTRARTLVQLGAGDVLFTEEDLRPR